MVEGLCVDRNRKTGVVDAAVSGRDQQLIVLLIGRKEDSIVKMDATKIRATPTSLPLLNNYCKQAFVS